MYGCRFPVILGGIIICTSYTAAAFSSQSVLTIVLLIGVGSGFGMSLIFYPTWIAANTYYKERRQLANAIVMSGAAIGVVLGAPFVSIVLNLYGLQGTFMILGGCALQTVLLGSLIPSLAPDGSHNEEHRSLLEKPINESKEDVTENNEVTMKDLLKLFKYRLFHTFIAVDLLKRWKLSIIVVVMVLLDSAAMSTIYTYLPDLIIQAGHNKKYSWQPITVLSITNMVARIVMGLKNKSFRTSVIIYMISAMIIGLTMVSFPLVQNYYLIICLMAGLFGLGKGLYMTLRGPVIAELVPEEDIDRAIGTGSSFCALAPIFIYPILGKMFDLTGNYTLTFLIPGISATVSGLLLFSILIGINRGK